LHIREYTQSALATSAHNAVDNLDQEGCSQGRACQQDQRLLLIG
tara:strand:+ start:537 stop:668 length:132 start_codon:yes stop_codon:yes gene_type:complete